MLPFFLPADLRDLKNAARMYSQRCRQSTQIAAGCALGTQGKAMLYTQARIRAEDFPGGFILPMQTQQELRFLEDKWDERLASGLDDAELLRYRSNVLGSDLRITNFGGGNTSSKIDESDP